MKIWSSIVVILLCSHSAGVLSDVYAYDGGKLYVENCVSCHGQSDSAGTRIAPPIVAVKDHYLRKYADKQEFVSALVSWVKHPTKDKTLMPGAIRRFGLMPAFSLAEQDLIAIAEFIFDQKLDKPDWYEKHYNAEHGTDRGKQVKDIQ